MNGLIRMKLSPPNRDLGLLALRVCGVLPLFIKHGWEKIFSFSAMSHHFPDPVHIGMVPSLIIAMLADSICSLLIIAGIATRWAALFSLVNLLVAWALVHHFEFIHSDHGEVIALYCAIMLTLFFSGPGRYSLGGARP